MAKADLIGGLNRTLAREHACMIGYLTHAPVITGPYAEAVASRLKEIAETKRSMQQNCGSVSWSCNAQRHRRKAHLDNLKEVGYQHYWPNKSAKKFESTADCT